MKDQANQLRAADEIVCVNMSIRSAINEISPFIDKVMLLIMQCNCVAAGEEISVEIALREAVTNAVLHGNKADPDKRVTVCCECAIGKGLSLIVRDEGKGFDPAGVADPTATENIERTHGRGIQLMRALMEEVHFAKGGTEVHIRKNVKHQSNTVPVTS